MRRSRHRSSQKQITPEIRITPRALATLLLFDRYRLLPLNWMHALIDTGHYAGYRDMCTKLWRAGFLDRRTLNGRTNNTETQSYSRSAVGTRFLKARGSNPLLNTTQRDPHQALVDLSEAHIELGARAAGIEYLPWRHILEHPKTPKLPESPFRFDIGDTVMIPDGRPFILRTSTGETALFVREIDRDTEAETTVHFKIAHYKLIHKYMKQRYAHPRVFLLFITTKEARRRKVLSLIANEFPNGCPWILTAVMPDHIHDCLPTAPVTQHLFTTPYERHGHPPFSLQTLSDTSQSKLAAN